MSQYMRPKRWDLILKTSLDSLVVTVAEVKASARMDASETLLDSTIERYIKAVQRKIERWAGITLLKTRFAGYYDEFPVVMVINKHPELTVEKIEYTDTNGLVKIVDPLIYQIQKMELHANIFENDGRAYPEVKTFTVDSVKITVLSGWLSASLVPEDIKSAIMMSVIKMLQGDCGDNEILTKGAIQLLKPYRNEMGWLEN
jgi:uncharacterized phiE125 gp8 family phage protein